MMDFRRYAIQQEGVYTSGYPAVHEADFRVGGTDSGRRFDRELSRDATYPWNASHWQIHDRDTHANSYRGIDSYRNQGFHMPEGVYTSALKGYPAVHEADFLVGGTDIGRRFDRELSRDATYPWNASHANSYHGIDSYRNQGFHMPARFAGRNHADFSPYDDGCDYSRRGDGHERDTEYGRSNYGSDCGKRSKRDGSWRRYDSHVCDHGKQISSMEGDPCPERSLCRGHDDRRRSRSPQVPSRWKEHYDDRQNHEHSSMVPSATVKVMGLSSNTTYEDLSRILAKWRPICGVRVVKKKESGSCRGYAFIDFPSVEAARTMMEEVGYDGLVDDGRELSFEYSVKKIKSKNQVMRDKRNLKRIMERAAVAAPAQQQEQEEEKEVPRRKEK